MRNNRVYGENEAYEFAAKWLPWIAAKTGLKYDWSMRVPEIEQMSKKELDDRYNNGLPSGDAAYLPMATKLVYCGDYSNASRDYIEGGLIHELVHFLQDKNGMLFKGSGYGVNEIERQAYATMRDWWIETGTRNAYGLTNPALFAKAVGMSVNGAR